MAPLHPVTQAELAAAQADERLRAAAAKDDAALVAYEAAWRRRLARMVRRHPARWHVPGWSAEEVMDELLLRLVVAVREGAREPAPRQGKEWSLLFLAAARRELRRRFRLETVVVEGTVPARRPGRTPTAEEHVLDAEDATLRERARISAEASLTRPQRRWLAAMKLSANGGGFFAASGDVNLAAAARVLDRDRSSATRAFAELQRTFARAREDEETDDDG